MSVEKKVEMRSWSDWSTEKLRELLDVPITGFKTLLTLDKVEFLIETLRRHTTAAAAIESLKKSYKYSDEIFQLLEGHAAQGLVEIDSETFEALRQEYRFCKRNRLFLGNTDTTSKVTQQLIDEFYDPVIVPKEWTFLRHDIRAEEDFFLSIFGVTQSEAIKAIREGITGVKDILKSSVEATLLTQTFVDSLPRDNDGMAIRKTFLDYEKAQKAEAKKEKNNQDKQQEGQMVEIPLGENAPDIETLKQALLKYAAQDNVMRLHVRYHLEKKELDTSPGHLALLQALAVLKKKNIRLWTLEKNNSLQLSTEWNKFKGADEIHLLFLENNRFELLEPVHSNNNRLSKFDKTRRILDHMKTQHGDMCLLLWVYHLNNKLFSPTPKFQKHFDSFVDICKAEDGADEDVQSTRAARFFELLHDPKSDINEYFGSLNTFSRSRLMDWKTQKEEEMKKNRGKRTERSPGGPGFDDKNPTAPKKGKEKLETPEKDVGVKPTPSPTK